MIDLAQQIGHGWRVEVSRDETRWIATIYDKETGDGWENQLRDLRHLATTVEGIAESFETDFGGTDQIIEHLREALDYINAAIAVLPRLKEQQP